MILGSELEERNGRIISPGKFEGCFRWAPHFWSLALEGCGDEEWEMDEGPSVSVFVVTDEDKIRFSELEHAVMLELFEDDNGFVHASVLQSFPPKS